VGSFGPLKESWDGRTQDWRARDLRGCGSHKCDWRRCHGVAFGAFIVCSIGVSAQTIVPAPARTAILRLSRRNLRRKETGLKGAPRIADAEVCTPTRAEDRLWVHRVRVKPIVGLLVGSIRVLSNRQEIFCLPRILCRQPSGFRYQP